MSQFSTTANVGFRACRKLGGGQAIQKTFAVSASNNEAYFIGDAVIMSATGKVRTLKNASTAAPLGVITSLMGSSGGRPIPLRFSLPTNGPFLTSGTAGFAVVNVDLNQTYVTGIDANVTEASFGIGAKVSAGAPRTQNGISGQSLNSTLTTSADGQFQIIGFAPVEMVGTRTSAASPVFVEVKMLRSTFAGNPI
jgi:hypothetical protein